MTLAVRAPVRLPSARVSLILAALFVAAPLVSTPGSWPSAAALRQTSPVSDLEARFIGNAAMVITDGSLTLVTDFPYKSGYSGYMTYAQSDIRSKTATTLALITHRHADHWEPSLFRRTNWKIAGPSDVTAGNPANRVMTLGRYNTFGLLAIEALATPHGSIGHYSYIVTWHGRRMYFSGDTAETDSLMAARDLDVAFVTPWLYRSAMRRGRIDAARVVIYHHRAGEQVPECGPNCIVPRQGETIRIGQKT